MVDAVASPVIRRYIADLAAVMERSFPGRLHAVFVLGSYADGTPVEGSDLDLAVLVKDAFEQGERDAMLGAIFELAAPVRLDLSLDDETGSPRPRFAPVLKLGSSLAWGEDVRDRIELPPFPAYLREVIRSSCWFMGLARGTDVPTYPPTFPDPDAEFFGYDVARVRGWYPEGTEQGTKELVVDVGRAASALASMRTGEFVVSKRDAIRRYCALEDGPWPEFVRDLHVRCREDWNHRVPDDRHDREALRDLCARTLAFENHALDAFRSYILERAAEGDDAERRAIKELLLPAVEWDPEVRSAL